MAVIKNPISQAWLCQYICAKQMGCWSFKMCRLILVYVHVMIFEYKSVSTHVDDSDERRDTKQPFSTSSRNPLIVDNTTTANTKEDDSLESGVQLIIGVTITALLLTIIAMLVFKVRRLYNIKEMSSQITDVDIDEFNKGAYSNFPPIDIDGIEPAVIIPYDLTRYEIPKDKMSKLVQDNDILGVTHGTVLTFRKGKVEGLVDPVLFKMVRFQTCECNQLKELVSELKIMIHIRKHENIVDLIGACTVDIPKGEMSIVLEYCSLGNLERYLRKFKPNEYENMQDFYKILLPDLIQWSCNIANGMDWLASNNVVHTDLATRNVLLTANKTAKISEFGLSCILDGCDTYVMKTQQPLPWRWMAIESLKSLEFSEKSDIWAYGVTLWEMFTIGDIPYGELNWHVQFLPELERGFRLNCPKYASKEIYNKMLECWHHDPTKRPTFSELANFFHELESKLKDVTVEDTVVYGTHSNKAVEIHPE